MINRGYFARVQAIRQAVDNFLERTSRGGEGGGQIVSLGAGWDTNFFRLRSSSREPARYVEVDHREVTCSKARSMMKSPALRDLLADVGEDGAREEAVIDAGAGTVRGRGYYLAPADLRGPESVRKVLDASSVDYREPTLILLECVVAYLDGKATKDLLSMIAESFGDCCVLIYDMIGPDDPFGQQLIFNVESRGCPLPGIRSYPTKESHVKLLSDCGFARSGVHDMREVYEKHVVAEERKRTERIEFLDELEEWHLIMAHYCLSYGHNGVFEIGECPFEAKR